jgi:hypothetical protein
VNESAAQVQPSKYDKPEKREDKKIDPKAQPAAKKTTAQVKKPVANKKPEEEIKTNNFYDEEMEQPDSSKNAFDEQPIGGKKNANTFDE